MIYNKEINGVKFTLVCESWRNSSGWGHEVTLYKNDTYQVGRVRVRYYNRTWECYQYQSAIKRVICDVIDHLRDRAKIVFKQLHGYKVMTKKRAVEFAAYLQQDQDYCMYMKLYQNF